MSPARQRSVSGLHAHAHQVQARRAEQGAPLIRSAGARGTYSIRGRRKPSQPLFNTQSDYHYDQYVPQGVPAEAELERRPSRAEQGAPLIRSAGARGTYSIRGRRKLSLPGRMHHSEPALDEREHEVDEFPGLPNLPPSQPLFNTQSDYHYDPWAEETVLAGENAPFR
jgi:hypothetical protein